MSIMVSNDLHVTFGQRHKQQDPFTIRARAYGMRGEFAVRELPGMGVLYASWHQP